MVMGLLGTAIVTFLGVYASFSLTSEEERKREAENRERNYISGLKLIYSELTINEEAIDTITTALKNIPDKPSALYENYTFLMQMSKGVRTKNFDTLIGAEAMSEISGRDDVFNCIQKAYYNIEKAISGLSLSREVFIEFKNKDDKTLPQELKGNVSAIITREVKKLDSTLNLIKIAEVRLLGVLSAQGVTFVLDR